MTVIHAHFDGKVFVPDQPVDCPTNRPIRLVLIEDDGAKHPLLELAVLAETFPDDAEWPADGAAEHDHYLYGTPKRGK